MPKLASSTWCNCQAIPGTPNYPGPWHERGGEAHYPCAPRKRSMRAGMQPMKIHALFAAYKDADNDLELVDAWDEYAVDANPDGFAEAIGKLADSTDIERWVKVILEVDEQLVRSALHPQAVTLPAAVVAPGVHHGPWVAQDIGRTVFARDLYGTVEDPEDVS